MVPRHRLRKRVGHRTSHLELLHGTLEKLTKDKRGKFRKHKREIPTGMRMEKLCRTYNKQPTHKRRAT